MNDTVQAALAEMLALQIPLVTPAAASGFGVDLVCFDDFTPGLSETDPQSDASLAQDNYHRLITPAGSLPDDLDYGKDITEYLSSGVTANDLIRMGGEIETELLKDDRNESVAATVIVSGTVPLTLRVTIVCTPADPDTTPFKLVINVDATGVFLEAIQ